MITTNKVVSVSYSLYAGEKGQQEQHIETANESQPLMWLYGVGSMIPAFEENLRGKMVSDSFDFHIAAHEAYGLYDSEAIVMIPIDVFKGEDGNIDNSMLQVGAILPMMDNEGNHLRGKVVEVTSEYVKMDFNHPLAGQDLHFTGKVLEVRDATPDEIAHGHVHGPHGHHH